MSNNKTLYDLKNDEIVITLDVFDGNKVGDSTTADDDVSKTCNLVKR